MAWSPCRPIHYVVDGGGAPDGFSDRVTAALAEVSAATGLTFRNDGAGAEAPDIDRLPFLPALYGDRWAPVLIRFADEATIKKLSGTVAGVANPIGTRDAVTGVMHLVSGSVYLDTSMLFRPETHGGPAYLPLLRHELGHLVGLDHVDDATQLMNPTTGSVETFQSGDLAGLAALGRGACAPGL